jgi:CTP:molybdopterin cytidylyltransferase MocA
MTQDEIIEMAKQAGLLPCQGIHMGDLKAFAKLVAEKEREQLTDAAMKAAEKAVDLAIALEREACAKEADKRLYDFTMLTSNPPQNGSAWSIASAIRARGQA